MNWLAAFWKKLTAPPPSPTRDTDTRSAAPTPPAGEPPSGNPPWTPITGIQADTLENFTPRAQQVLALARKEAGRLNHNFVGTEHVLLGLMQLGQGVAVNVLCRIGLNLESLRAEVEKQIGTGPDQKIIGNIPFTPRVKKVLALAAKEAKALHHTYVGTEHILLGLLREGDGVAARVLNNLGVDIERTRQATLDEYGPKFGASSASAGIAEFPGATLNAPTPDRSELPRDRFTPRVRRTFTLALEEAEVQNNPVVETEHVLLGLLRMGHGVAASVLIKIGVNAEIVAAHLDPPLPAPSPGKPETPAFSPLVKEVLAFAAEEARELDHTYIGTEHILLGLLRQPHGRAARILKDLCVDPEALRKQVLLAFEVKKIEPHVAAAGALPPSEKDTEMYAKKGTPPASPSPSPANPPREPVDLTRRYDVYCVEHQKTIIHRNVRFKATKTLLPRHDYDQASDYLELEQPDGQGIFVNKSTILRFCAPGAKPEIENL